ncbi:MAG: type I-C CRISPR-associated endonuclease Cas1c [Acidobacteriota bacterium]|nr:type I-C CRISPR-associated endonuclease Cas1c [Blastocatellia bacterium]MDW8413022.1 type I-C CRISPR-associated endonuclease Cas1c [Acidobacteriota bacterium]
MEIRQNILYLTASGNYISRDHLTLKIHSEGQLKLAIPIHHLESICSFGQNTFTPAALELCWEHGVSVSYFTEYGHLQGRWEGIPNKSVLLRRLQFRLADNPDFCTKLSKYFVAGKIHNSRQSFLRTARELTDEADIASAKQVAEELSNILRWLKEADTLDKVRGLEGQAANVYFGSFNLHLKQQQETFLFTSRSKRPPLDRINCLLSFLYALVRNDCISALATVGLDPFVGYLHAERPNRPALALDLMEEFRPILADRIAITMINRKQICESDFVLREGGAVELTQNGRKAIIIAYQSRKKDTLVHPVLEQEISYGQVFIVQAKILARYLRGDIPEYYPFITK